MSGELNRLKEAHAAWVAEKPSERKGKLLTEEEAREIARRAAELQRRRVAATPLGQQKYEHFT
jgi:hypothetical protein